MTRNKRPAPTEPAAWREPAPVDQPALSSLGNDHPPGDWSELGRLVLAEARRRAREELARRHAPVPEDHP